MRLTIWIKLTLAVMLVFTILQSYAAPIGRSLAVRGGSKPGGARATFKKAINVVKVSTRPTRGAARNALKTAGRATRALVRKKPEEVGRGRSLTRGLLRKSSSSSSRGSSGGSRSRSPSRGSSRSRSSSRDSRRGRSPVRKPGNVKTKVKGALKAVGVIKSEESKRQRLRKQSSQLGPKQSKLKQRCQQGSAFKLKNNKKGEHEGVGTDYQPGAGTITSPGPGLKAKAPGLLMDAAGYITDPQSKIMSTAITEGFKRLPSKIREGKPDEKNRPGPVTPIGAAVAVGKAAYGQTELSQKMADHVYQKLPSSDSDSDSE
ncbi:hypothetical protein BC829DRAFT_387032 [Chytridium lagenaria]|nr:hypothetical protein BC829DRAFT_387032 [Chytridium lagenaria]